MSALRLRFRVTPELLDALGECLFEAGAQGLEEAGASDTWITYVPSETEAAPLLEAYADFRQRVSLLLPELSLEGVSLEPAGNDWQERWLAALEAEQLTADFWLRPTTRRPAPPGERTLWFEPSQSFGAGSHATTKMAAEASQEWLESHPGLRVFDVGTGNGVLSLLALRCGASSALAVDIDELAVAAALENARLNELEEGLEVRCASADATTESFSLVLANIDTRTLARLAVQLTARVAAGGRLLLTGLLDEDADALAQTYRSAGLSESGRRSLGGWTLLEMSRAP